MKQQYLSAAKSPHLQMESKMTLKIANQRFPLEHTLKRYFTEYSKHIFPEKELRGHSPNAYIHFSVCDLNISTSGLHILL
jgi:hypothetical protein